MSHLMTHKLVGFLHCSSHLPNNLSNFRKIFYTPGLKTSPFSALVLFSLDSLLEEVNRNTDLFQCRLVLIFYKADMQFLT